MIRAPYDLCVNSAGLAGLSCKEESICHRFREVCFMEGALIIVCIVVVRLPRSEMITTIFTRLLLLERLIHLLPNC
jgi:hypothetical protein